MSYKKLIFPEFSITAGDSGSANNCILTRDSRVAIVRNIIAQDKEIMLLVQVFRKQRDLFVFPLHSSKVGIYEVADPGPLDFLSLNSMYCKCTLLPHREHFVAIKMINTFSTATQ